LKTVLNNPAYSATKLLRESLSSFAEALCLVSLSLVLVFIFSVSGIAQGNFENRKISDIQIIFEGTDKDLSAADQFRLIVASVLGERYSTVRIRDAIEALYETKKVVSASVEAIENGESEVALRFVIKRKTLVERILFRIGNTEGEPVTEEELLLRVNLLKLGSTITDQTLRTNADLIQEYLRARGFYNAEVNFSQTALGSESRVAVSFQINPNVQARISDYEISIENFESSKLLPKLKLQKGGAFSSKLLADDIARIRQTILKQDFLAPQINDPKVIFDPETNSVAVAINGKLGPKVNVTIDSKIKVGSKTQERILPVRREGSLDFSAIKEGERRLRNRFQEQGYFFVEVTPLCSVTPEFPRDETNLLLNNSAELCSALSGADLAGKSVDIKYAVDLNRRLKLVNIRIEGTDEIKPSDVITILDTQEASLIGLIPRLGYGRGYTSNELLEEDRIRIESVMRELGFRQALTKVKQGVSPDGEELIITFVVKEGPPTRISDVSITGNKEFPSAALEKELPNLIGKNYSRARARNGARKLQEFYSKEGYYNARVEQSIVEIPSDPKANEEQVKIIFNVANEGKKVFINRVLVNGNSLTKRESIFKAIPLRPNELLRSNEIFLSEQNLYSSDAFRRVDIKVEPAGETASGDRQTDVIVNVEEQKAILADGSFGYSTEFGPKFSVGLRHINLLGRLQQLGSRLSWSPRQQLIQVDYLNPRFIPDGKNRFAPLSLTAQYQRDSTVTRFFRSAFDRGTFGVVQRIDANGNPIDEFGAGAGDPTINRLSFTAETQRTISRASRSIAFFRYRFEDVKLVNINSLLIKELLEPDSQIRTSGFGASFVRDTRENCSRRYSILELISRGEFGDPCRYNPSDPTRGHYLTADYGFSVPALGANIGFHKFQASYQTYYTFPQFRNTTFAGRAVLGLAGVFSARRRFSSTQFPELNGILPISERFFGGGSTTLRGFDFDTAGPRVVIVPQGTFRDSNGQIVSLNPFTVPFGGNALAIVNLEARIPVSKFFQTVPFYDGGNVFRSVKDLFNPPNAPATDVFRSNLRALWTNTVGLGFRIKTPLGGSVAIDYGFLLNPPEFLIPQTTGPNATYRLHQGQIHFRFTQTF